LLPETSFGSHYLFWQEELLEVFNKVGLIKSDGKYSGKNC